MVRDTLRRSLANTGARITFEGVEGPYPSQALLIDGIDVAGHSPTLDHGVSTVHVGQRYTLGILLHDAA